MPTRAEYSERLQPLLSEGFSNKLLTAAPEETFSIDELAGTLGAIIEELVQQHMGASAHVQALMASQESPPWASDGELAFYSIICTIRRTSCARKSMPCRN